MRGHGHGLEDLLDVVLIEALARQVLARVAGHKLLRARARGHALRGDADQPARAEVRARRRAVEGVQLLGLDAADRRRLVLGEARLDRDLGAPGVLPGAHQLRDVLGQGLGLERRLAEDHLADRLVDHLLEPGHVRAFLVRAQLDHALEPRREQLLGAVLLDADHLLDAGDADTREAQLDRRPAGLDVGNRDVGGHAVQSRERRRPAPAAPRPGCRRGVAGSAAAPRARVPPDRGRATRGAQAHRQGPKSPGHRRRLWYHSCSAHLGDMRERAAGVPWPGGLPARVV